MQISYTHNHVQSDAKAEVSRFLSERQGHAEFMRESHEGIYQTNSPDYSTQVVRTSKIGRASMRTSGTICRTHPSLVERDPILQAAVP